ncbi:hypothetical protein G166_gp59 [Clostridium phage phi8074-B1]|uniref:hypothetical protein n=1 Tax=Clostridium phage phi8074-B1 TaxID=1147137 RepID=UPI00025C0C6E|nr:hypothetical protein G166_gp59 [Clostridium phage phi8074-B1]AFC61991.1 hypothetical protein phi8074-B1_00059 [Clostridium phage phi8074-B1]
MEFDILGEHQLQPRQDGDLIVTQYDKYLVISTNQGLGLLSLVDNILYVRDLQVCSDIPIFLKEKYNEDVVRIIPRENLKLMEVVNND